MTRSCFQVHRPCKSCSMSWKSPPAVRCMVIDCVWSLALSLSVTWVPCVLVLRLCFKVTILGLSMPFKATLDFWNLPAFCMRMKLSVATSCFLEALFGKVWSSMTSFAFHVSLPIRALKQPCPSAVLKPPKGPMHSMKSGALTKRPFEGPRSLRSLVPKSTQVWKRGMLALLQYQPQSANVLHWPHFPCVLLPCPSFLVVLRLGSVEIGSLWWCSGDVSPVCCPNCLRFAIGLLMKVMMSWDCPGMLPKSWSCAVS